MFCRQVGSYQINECNDNHLANHNYYSTSSSENLNYNESLVSDSDNISFESLPINDNRFFETNPINTLIKRASSCSPTLYRNEKTNKFLKDLFGKDDSVEWTTKNKF